MDPQRPTTGLQRPPTRHERDSFYFGLPSRPKLVARSSLTPFHFDGDGWSSDRKTLTVVGDHPIVSKWDDEPSPLRNKILGILAEQDVDWQAIDILRIGYVNKEKPVIVSISVSAPTSWETGNKVAQDCREALVQYGLDDVHCEVKESMLVNSSFAVLRQDYHPHSFNFHPYMYRLSDQLGTAIASRDKPDREGTKGLYLRRTGCEPGEVFALTCRHVCYGASEQDSQLPGKETRPGKSVIQLPEITTKTLVEDLDEWRQELTKDLEKEESKGECYQDRERRSSKITAYQQDIRETDRLLQQFTLRNALDTRVFGHVADWCLIRLKADAHERRLSELSNRVYIGPPQSTLSLMAAGFLPASELQNPKKKLIVGMRGRTSGLTFGLVNQVKSVTRRPITDGQTFISKECCIVGDRANREFTQHGDSGACVFDLNGRAVAMVTGGISRQQVSKGGDDYGLDRAMDVTYATPMEWLLEDMKACGLSMEIL
ncbi:hypothetical protein CH063_04888 [Colletotrichum higginsianum]|uniref:Uncharacterized protein n=1 Tax=Colletotrichum higginsianum (strain IMI 349063) TaxID=759273 RepID=H1UX11_COLHI|nr:hypothetical protein CH063_04888 [Colletotrichum higginsianum]